CGPRSYSLLPSLLALCQHCALDGAVNNVFDTVIVGDPARKRPAAPAGERPAYAVRKRPADAVSKRPADAVSKRPADAVRKRPAAGDPDVAVRFRYFLEQASLTREEFVAATDGAITARSLYAVLSGARRPSRALAVLIERTWGFRADFLLHGTGEMWSQ